jgi:hypothetical protein
MKYGIGVVMCMAAGILSAHWGLPPHRFAVVAALLVFGAALMNPWTRWRE